MPGYFGPTALESVQPPAWSLGETPEQADERVGRASRRQHDEQLDPDRRIRAHRRAGARGRGPRNRPRRGWASARTRRHHRGPRQRGRGRRAVRRGLPAPEVEDADRSGPGRPSRALGRQLRRAPRRRPIGCRRGGAGRRSAGRLDVHGPTALRPDVRRPAAAAAFVAAIRPRPSWGVLLVRKGGFAVARLERDRLVESKVGQRHVQGRTKAGGQSQQRFARRRDNQARQAYEAAADHAARILGGRTDRRRRPAATTPPSTRCWPTRGCGGYGGRAVARRARPEARGPRPGGRRRVRDPGRRRQRLIGSCARQRAGARPQAHDRTALRGCSHVAARAGWRAPARRRGALDRGCLADCARRPARGRQAAERTRAGRPAGAERPPALRLLAARRRRRHRAARRATPGLRAPARTAVEEDDEGITLTQDWVEDAANSGLFAAHALGRFAGAELGDAPWLARDQLRDRMARVERAAAGRPWPGRRSPTWPTTCGDGASAARRARRAAPGRPARRPGPGQPAGPRGRRRGGHRLGDARARPGRRRPRLLRCSAPARSSSRCSTPTCWGCRTGLATREEAALGARVTAVYTALNRAEWALARVAGGEGALAGEVPPPRRRAAPAGAAAAVPADRGACRSVIHLSGSGRLRPAPGAARRRVRCRTRA